LGTQSASGKAPKKVANSLVALSSAAVLAIYAAGYSKTRSAAEEFDLAAQRRPVVPAPPPQAAPAHAATPTPALPTPDTDSATDGAVASIAPAAGPPSAPPPPSAPVTSTPAAIPAPAANEVSTKSIGEPDPATSKTDKAEPAPAAPAVSYKDGTFHGWGHSRHGDIYSFVVIEKGRIVHSGYDKCRTRWPCTLVDHLGPQVVKRQGADVDYVSGATESGNAFYWGIVEALTHAKAASEEPQAPKADAPDSK
jgi:uncharacterized protein with FMN-binding domain